MAAADTAHPRPARWRSPAGWPLRTRLVATMIALLAVLGLVVGGTAELYLYQSLHRQAETELGDIAKRLGGRGGDWFNGPSPSQGSPNGGYHPSPDNLPPGIPGKAIVLRQN